MAKKESIVRKATFAAFFQETINRKNPDLLLRQCDLLPLTYKVLAVKEPHSYTYKDEEDLKEMSKSIQSAVSRALEDLVSEEFQHLEKVGKSHYRLNHKNSQRILIADAIKNMIVFLKKNIFVASPSVLVMAISGDSLRNAEILFKQYFFYEQDDIFDILPYDEKLFIFIQNESAQEDIKNRLSEIVAKGFEQPKTDDFETDFFDIIL